MEPGEFSVERINGGFQIKNIGDIAVPFIYGYQEEGRAWIFIKDNYTTLFPGEERELTVDIIGENEKGLTPEDLSILWCSLNG
jgi:hypothetical protein